MNIYIQRIDELSLTIPKLLNELNLDQTNLLLLIKSPNTYRLVIQTYKHSISTNPIRKLNGPAPLLL